MPVDEKLTTARSRAPVAHPLSSPQHWIWTGAAALLFLLAVALMMLSVWTAS